MKEFYKIKKSISSLLLVTVTLSLYTIYGCKEDSSVVNPPPPTVLTVDVNGTINTNEIGGSDLLVQSLYKQNCQVTSGQYATKVSNVGTQLLFITDGSQQLRGLTLSKLENQNPSLHSGDALSTAFSLMFLSPGIATINSDSTNARLNRFVGLQSFQNLVGYLRNNLTTNSLSFLLSQNPLQSLLYNSISEYSGIDTLNLSRGEENYFDVKKIEDANVDKFELKNSGWRYAKVVRRDIIDDNQPPRHTETIFDAMEGVTPLSIGSIFSLSSGSAKIETKQKNKEPDISKYEFWVLGLGFKNPNPYPLPNDIQLEYNTAVINTMIFYVVFPIIELISGGISFIGKTVPEILHLVSTLSSGISGSINVKQLQNFINSGSYHSAAGAAADLGITILSLLLGTNGLVATGILSAEVAIILAAILGVITLPFIAANLAVAIAHYFLTYDIYRYDVQNISGCDSINSITDINGNVYQVVKIGTQCWTVQNLKTTRYNDGMSIPNVTDSATWTNLTTGAWAYYNYQSSYNNPYGKLYNWYAINTGKLCPLGWRIPTDADWTILTDYLGGEEIAGGKMKSTQYWDPPNVGATNSSGFSGLPGGDFFHNGSFFVFGHEGFYWSSTIYDSQTSFSRWLSTAYVKAFRIRDYFGSGLSCRCLKN